MSQKSITSFFTVLPAKPKENNSNGPNVSRESIESPKQITGPKTTAKRVKGTKKEKLLPGIEKALNKSKEENKISVTDEEKSPEKTVKVTKASANKTSEKAEKSPKASKGKSPKINGKDSKHSENSDIGSTEETEINVKSLKKNLTAKLKKKASTSDASDTEEKVAKKPKKKRRKIIVQSDSSSDEEAIVKKEEDNQIKADAIKRNNESENEDVEMKDIQGNIKEEITDKEEKKKDKLSEVIKRDVEMKEVQVEKEEKIEESKEKKKKNNESKKEKKKTEESKEKEKKTVHSFFTAKAQNKTSPAKPNSKNSSASDGSQYDPTSAKYHPIDDAVWDRNEKVPYIALSRTFEEIENISARLKIVEILSNYLRSVIVLTPEDLVPSVYLCLNKLAPAYEGIELGIAETNLMKAIAQSTGRTLAQIKADVHQSGDLGLVAEKSKSNQRMIFQPAKLTVRGVFEKLKEIAKLTGNSSQNQKVQKIQSMFVACRYSEARFLIRSMEGKLRIGLAEQSVLQALALACTMTPSGQEEFPPPILNASKGKSTDSFKALYDEAALILKTTYCECPNYDKIIPVLLKEGIADLPKHCKLTPGIPLKPMLAHPTKGVQEVLQRFENMKFTCEWKYDGERAQIHIHESGEVSIYSRNQENNTSKYPDIISRLDALKTDTIKSCILDCEAVAWDKEKQQILPFQILSTRKRKDANEADIKVQVCVFMFDLLYFNGEPLVKEPFAKRRALLKEHFKEVEGQWKFATAMDTSTMEEVQEFLDESVKGNCEGLMVKTLEEDATYEIAKRSRNWLKLKKDYLEGIGDTLDVVVLGGYLGKGKRTGTYGGFLLGCYDQENEEYQSICKIGTGFSDEALQTHTEFLKNHIINEPKSYYRYDNSHEPDHWFEAVQVWEIKCADLSLSPVHRAAAGIVDPEKGISLRFPRFIRIRDDKTVEEATSAQQVADMYSNQDQIKNQQGSSTKAAEEDFY